MRKKIIAANWKMNLSYAEAMSLTDALVGSAADCEYCEVIIGAPFVYLHDIVARIQSQTCFSVAGQNCSDEDKGAFTGETSAAMLASIGVDYVIIGHSERRSIYKETDQFIAGKVSKALEYGLLPIFCCGENIFQRKENKHFNTVENQLKNGLFHIDASLLSECIIAYEPVWAIGTGVNATAKEAQEMHAFIRQTIKDNFNQEIAGNVSVIYGGSVNAKNSDELFHCPDVDGGLVGGASLKANEFISIMRSMNSLFKVKGAI